jgi:hypothetical protein
VKAPIQRALAGRSVAAFAEPDSGSWDPTVELSAPVNAAGQKAADDEQATGWIGRVDTNAGVGLETFSVYVVCAVPPIPPG